mmetsp:Transcript_12156/g.44366  ORF Transcript_12156/g.44366 Transcript_12156/m.44366 type:complete len:485 (-) Transcript_12156:802-2256(-)
MQLYTSGPNTASSSGQASVFAQFANAPPVKNTTTPNNKESTTAPSWLGQTAQPQALPAEKPQGGLGTAATVAPEAPSISKQEPAKPTRKETGRLAAQQRLQARKMKYEQKRAAKAAATEARKQQRAAALAAKRAKQEELRQARLAKAQSTANTSDGGGSFLPVLFAAAGGAVAFATQKKILVPKDGENFDLQRLVRGEQEVEVDQARLADLWSSISSGLSDATARARQAVDEARGDDTAETAHALMAKMSQAEENEKASTAQMTDGVGTTRETEKASTAQTTPAVQTAKETTSVRAAPTFNAIKTTEVAEKARQPQAVTTKVTAKDKVSLSPSAVTPGSQSSKTWTSTYAKAAPATDGGSGSVGAAPPASKDGNTLSVGALEASQVSKASTTPSTTKATPSTVETATAIVVAEKPGTNIFISILKSLAYGSVGVATLFTAWLFFGEVALIGTLVLSPVALSRRRRHNREKQSAARAQKAIPAAT